MRLILTLLFLPLATPALAVDGVLEINQTCAAVGCFPGDEPGFPVTIQREQPGSYRLTTNLVIGDANADVIKVHDSHVTVDLNGFSISGPNICSGMPLTCTALGMGSGVISAEIEPGQPPPTGVHVENGVVRGMGNSGIALAGTSNHVEGILAVSNGGNGIFDGGGGSTVTKCRVERNRTWGISTRPGSLVSHNVVIQNGTGIDPSEFAGPGGKGGSLIVDNVIVENVLGAFLDSADGYARNVFRGNGTNVTGGAQIGTNLCDGAACP